MALAMEKEGEYYFLAPITTLKCCGCPVNPTSPLVLLNSEMEGREVNPPMREFYLEITHQPLTC
jgi:hypothetical protein